MTRAEVKKLILTGARNDVAAVLSKPPAARPGKWMGALEAWNRRRAVYQDAENGITKYEPVRWLGRTPTGGERAHFSLALAELVTEGRVAKRSYAGSTRTIEIQLLDSIEQTTERKCH
jgi:hypothetical protein